jgi:hypothetical protein
MRAIAVFVSLMLLAGCHDEKEVTGTTSQCAAGLFSSYNPKNLNQCVAVCIKCERGAMTTCSTSCRLKGAE